jgi:hypothetical protein
VGFCAPRPGSGPVLWLGNQAAWRSGDQPAWRSGDQPAWRKW